jgi:hypothetical protein
MSEPVNDPEGGRSEPGKTEKPGKPYRPSQSGTEDEPLSGEPKNVPHGLPISDEEYERLKEQSRQHPPRKNHGQEDPGPKQ